MPFSPNRIPVLKKDAGQAAHRLSRKTYAGVKPVAVGMGDVKVLLRQIVAAGKAHLAVDDRYFPVVSVIQKGVEEGRHRIKHARLYSRRLHAAYEIVIDKPNAADVIVKKSHLYARRGTLGKYFKKALECRLFLDGMILHEDKALCLFKRLELRLKSLFRGRIKTDIGVAVNRVPESVGEISELVCDTVVHALQLFQNTALLRHGREQMLVYDFVAPTHAPGRAVKTDQKIQRYAEKGSPCNQKNPGHFHSRVDVSPVNTEHQNKGDPVDQERNPGVVSSQIAEYYVDPYEFHDNCKQRKHAPLDSVPHLCFSLDSHCPSHSVRPPFCPSDVLLSVTRGAFLVAFLSTLLLLCAALC